MFTTAQANTVRALRINTQVEFVHYADHDGKLPEGKQGRNSFSR